MDEETVVLDSYLAFDSYLSGEKHPHNFLFMNDEGDYSSFAMPGEEAEFLREVYDDNGTELDRDFYPLVHHLGGYADSLRFELPEAIDDGVQKMPEGQVVYRSDAADSRWDARMDKGIVAALLGGGEFETIRENVSDLEEVKQEFEELERYPPETRRVVPFDRSIFEVPEPGIQPSEYQTMRFQQMDDEMTESIRDTEFREGLHPSSPMIVRLDGYDREFVPGVLGSENAEKFFRRQTGYGTDTILQEGLDENRTRDLSRWVSDILEAEEVDASLYSEISEISEGDVTNPADPHRNQEVKGFATTSYLYFEEEDALVEIPNGVFVDMFTEDQEFEGHVRASPELPDMDDNHQDPDLPSFQ